MPRFGYRRERGEHCAGQVRGPQDVAQEAMVIRRCYLRLVGILPAVRACGQGCAQIVRDLIGDLLTSAIQRFRCARAIELEVLGELSPIRPVSAPGNAGCLEPRWRMVGWSHLMDLRSAYRPRVTGTR